MGVLFSQFLVMFTIGQCRPTMSVFQALVGHHLMSQRTSETDISFLIEELQEWDNSGTKIQGVKCNLSVHVKGKGDAKSPELVKIEPMFINLNGKKPKNLCEVPSLIESLRCFELLKQCVGDGELVSFKDRCAEGGKVAPQGGGVGVRRGEQWWGARRGEGEY